MEEHTTMPIQGSSDTVILTTHHILFRHSFANQPISNIVGSEYIVIIEPDERNHP